MDGITGLSSDADRKSIEKHRLRLELQHRRKVQKLRQRLENRKRKQAGVSNVIIVSSSPASADAASAAAAVSTTIPGKRRNKPVLASHTVSKMCNYFTFRLSSCAIHSILSFFRICISTCVHFFSNHYYGVQTDAWRENKAT